MKNKVIKIEYRKEINPFTKKKQWCAIYNNVILSLSYSTLAKAKELAPKRLEYLKQHGEERIKIKLNVQ